MLQVTQETRSGWCVVTVKGRASGETADQLEKELRTAVERHDKVAVDFSALGYVSSAGVRAVLQAAHAAQIRKTEFAICALSAPVKRVFDMSGLHLVVRVEEALPC